MIFFFFYCITKGREVVAQVRLPSSNPAAHNLGVRVRDKNAVDKYVRDDVLELKLKETCWG